MSRDRRADTNRETDDDRDDDGNGLSATGRATIHQTRNDGQSDDVSKYPGAGRAMRWRADRGRFRHTKRASIGRTDAEHVSRT